MISDILGKSKCARCHRPFTPKKQDQRYGPTCARKLAGQVELDSQALVSGKVLRHKERCAPDVRLREDMAHVIPGDP